ncbi:hypothetical protein C5167_026980, partial [Papaver somniferum]
YRIEERENHSTSLFFLLASHPLIFLCKNMKPYFCNGELNPNPVFLFYHHRSYPHHELFSFITINSSFSCHTQNQQNP